MRNDLVVLLCYRRGLALRAHARRHGDCWGSRHLKRRSGNDCEHGGAGRYCSLSAGGAHGTRPDSHAPPGPRRLAARPGVVAPSCTRPATISRKRSTGIVLRALMNLAAISPTTIRRGGRSLSIAATTCSAKVPGSLPRSWVLRSSSPSTHRRLGPQHRVLRSRVVKADRRAHAVRLHERHGDPNADQLIVECLRDRFEPLIWRDHVIASSRQARHKRQL